MEDREANSAMKHRDAELVEYAKRRARVSKRSASGLIIMGTMTLAAFACLAWELLAGPMSRIDPLCLDSRFMLGVAFGVQFMLLSVIGAVGFVKVFRISRGIEAQAFGLLVRLAEERGQMKRQ